MSSIFHADMQNAVVRMVVPMRREFGFALDVQKMRRDRAYAETIVAQALTSRVERLRDCARLVGYHLRAAQPAPEPSPAPAERAAASSDVHDDAARAARLLIDLIGPMGEPLAIRIERAADTPALAHLIGEAQARIADMRGQAAASDYVAQATRAGAKPGAATTARVSPAALRRAAQNAARELVALVGPLGNALAERIERCTDEQVLVTLLAEAHDGITAVIGISAANEFVQRVTPRQN